MSVSLSHGFEESQYDDISGIPLWGVWRYDPGPDGKPTKVPYNPMTGARAKPNTPSTFGSRAQAERARDSGKYSGLCYLVDASLGITAGDLDHVVPKADAFNEAALPPAVRRIIRIANTDTTWSPSGTGIHFIFGTTIDGYENRNSARVICHAEAYNRVRFMTHTDRRISGTPATLNDDPDDLTAWYEALGFRKREAEQPPQPQPERAILSLATEEIITRASNASAKFRELYDGGLCGKQSASEARYALMSSLLFWTRDPGQIEDIVRNSGQWNAKTRKRPELVRKEIDKLLRAYTGPQYDPNHHGTPHLTIVPNANDDALSCPDVRAELAAERARNAELEARVLVLQERVRLADEREAVWRNTKLGAARQTGAALVSLFREERPKEPGTTTPYRMPLAKLADRTGLDEGTCSRHLKQLATYRTPAGDPVLYADTRPIPRSVNQETGEVIEPHKEVWVGPGPIQQDAFGHVLATLAPKEAPKHGGKPDRNVCPKHPNAGVLRRTRTMRRITHECAHCHDVLDTQVVPVGRESTEHLRSMAGPPDPIPHDAFAPETDEPATAAPIPHLAPSIDTHVGKNLSGKMRDRPTPGQQPLLGQPPGPPPGWEDEHRRMYGEWYRGDGAA